MVDAPSGSRRGCHGRTSDGWATFRAAAAAVAMEGQVMDGRRSEQRPPPLPSWKDERWVGDAPSSSRRGCHGRRTSDGRATLQAAAAAVAMKGQAMY